MTERTAPTGSVTPHPRTLDKTRCGHWDRQSHEHCPCIDGLRAFIPGTRCPGHSPTMTGDDTIVRFNPDGWNDPEGKPAHCTSRAQRADCTEMPVYRTVRPFDGGMGLTIGFLRMPCAKAESGHATEAVATAVAALGAGLSDDRCPGCSRPAANRTADGRQLHYGACEFHTGPAA